MKTVNLYQGDCLEILKKLPENSIDLLLTDPPYVLNTKGGGTVNKKMKLSESLADVEKAKIINGYDIELFGQEFLRVMKEINAYFWCNKAQIYDYLKFYVGQLKCKFDIICWHKTNALPTYSNKYLSDTEYLLYFRKGKGKCFPHSYEDAKTYYLSVSNLKDKKVWKHPTIKPLCVTEKIIRNSSKETHTILDPFMGSGTTGVACINTNRNFIGVELDEKYYKIAEERINSAIKQTT